MNAPLPNWNSQIVCSPYLLYFNEKDKKGRVYPLDSKVGPYSEMTASYSENIVFLTYINILGFKKPVKTLKKCSEFTNRQVFPSAPQLKVQLSGNPSHKMLIGQLGGSKSSPMCFYNRWQQSEIEASVAKNREIEASEL